MQDCQRSEEWELVTHLFALFCPTAAVMFITVPGCYGSTEVIPSSAAGCCRPFFHKWRSPKVLKNDRMIYFLRLDCLSARQTEVGGSPGNPPIPSLSLCSLWPSVTRGKASLSVCASVSSANDVSVFLTGATHVGCKACEGVGLREFSGQLRMER